MIPELLGLIAVATLFGSMAFFSGVVAPLIFVKLEAATAGRFVRAIFPWYYLVIIALSLIGAGALALLHPVAAALLALIGGAAILARQVLMPRINRMRDRALDDDRGAERRFAQLHRLSVWINGAQLLGALAVLIMIATARGA